MRSVILAVLMLVGALSMNGCAQGFFDSPVIGKKAVNFTLETIKGGPLAFETFRNKRKAIIFFWATWCPHCREQINEVMARKAEMEKENIAVALVDIGEPKATAVKFLESKKIDLMAFLDESSAVAEQYQVVGIPTMVFISSDGVVRASENAFPEDYLKILK
ncbi:MAG: TlpA family protein disulfide reductase [Candidatus Omnitrophica bacterium]|nr:TlpA family protein disulfide reductase [Candidatus Omnitrophota bacterium]